jgi:Response regulator containing a CheY-like receiver domain and an HTH DNA-binding domain
MIKILFRDNDQYYQLGLRHWISDFLEKEFGIASCYLSTLSRDNIIDADIVILPLCRGENRFCFPELRARMKGLAIGIIDEVNQKDESLPHCFKRMVMIHRGAPLSEWLQQIRIQLSGSFSGTQRVNCKSCRCESLSDQQFRVLEELYREKTVPEVADELNINQKTVYAHKYQMMRKFRLRTDFELVTFMNKVYRRRIEIENIG